MALILILNKEKDKIKPINQQQKYKNEEIHPLLNIDFSSFKKVAKDS